MSHLFKNEKGLILVTVVIFVLIISILAVTILFVMTNEARLTERQIRRIKAGYAVQAGIQNYLNLLKSNPDPGETTIIVEGMDVVVDNYLSEETGCPDDVTNDSDPACIKATVDY